MLASVEVVDQCARQKGLTSQHPTHPVPLSEKVIKADTVFMHVMLPSIPSSSDLTTSHERTHRSKQTCFYRSSDGRLNPKDEITSSWKLAYVTDDLRLYDGESELNNPTTMMLLLPLLLLLLLLVLMMMKSCLRRGFVCISDAD